jgi:hypothetical protein
MKRVAGLVLALLWLSAGGSLAQGPSPAEVAASIGIAEVRAGVMIDEVELYDAAPHIVPRPDTISLGNLSTVSFDVLFRSPDIAAFRWLGSPRPTVGFDYDFRHESMAHLSLNWHIPLGSSRFYVEPELGGAIHNGALTGAVAPARNLGCRTLFYWSINVGYEISDRLDLNLTQQHASQAGLCGVTTNQGINYIGMRLGYKF